MLQDDGLAQGAGEGQASDGAMAGKAGAAPDHAPPPNSIIPALPSQPTATPITTTVTVETTSANLYVPYTVASGATVYATSLYALFGSNGPGFMSPLVNNGTIWNEVTDDSGQTLSMIGQFNDVHGVENNGLMVVHLGAATTRNAFAFQETTVTNSGQIFVINEGAGNAWLLRSTLGGPTVNRGLVAVQAQHGMAIGYEYDNDAAFENRAGAQLLVEGVGAIAFYAGRGDRPNALQLSNAGTIIAHSLDPNELSFGFYVAGLTSETTAITNSGLLVADVAIFGDDDAATVSQDFVQLVHNLASGEIWGLIYLQRGADSLDNAGVIHGDVYMGDGNDTVDTQAGVIDGITDLGWGDDSYRGGGAADAVAGGSGADQIDGGGGNDLLIGGGGADVLTGGAGNDGLFGEWGNDRIVTLGGDYVGGGDGDDRIELGDYGFEHVDGGDGYDTLVLPGGARSLNLHSALDDHALADIEEIELGGDKTLVIEASDITGLTGGETALRLVTGASDHVDLVGNWVRGADVAFHGQTWQVYTFDVPAGNPVSVLVRGGAQVTTGATAGSGGTLDPVAPGGLAPLPGEDRLDFTDPVSFISNYELTRSTTVEYYESWVSDDGSPVVTIYGSGITLTNDGEILSYRPAGNTAGNAAFAVRAPNAERVVNNGTISIESDVAGAIGSPAFALNGGTFTTVENHGQILAYSAQSTAEGVQAGQFFNDGSILVEAAMGSAFGVHMVGQAFENRGTITVHSDGLETIGGLTLPPMYGLPAAVGAWLREGLHVNSGTITASATTGGSAAIAYDLTGAGSLTNRGTLEGEYALWERGQSAQSIFQLYNYGQMTGKVQLGLANDYVENHGRIEGAVWLGAGDDVFQGSDGVQTGVIFGDDGNDRITGGSGVDYVDGGAGNDTIDGGAGDDFLAGGAGDDVFHVDGQGDLTFEDAGGGRDTVVASASVYLYANIENLTLEAGTAAQYGVGNDLDNILTGNGQDNLLVAHGGADTLFGGGGADRLYGMTGDDTIWGGAGIDWLVGDDGNDVLHGEDGAGEQDLLYGWAGNDTYYVDAQNDFTFEDVNGGTDSVFANIAGGTYYLYANVENLTLQGTTLYGVGNELANRITGSASANWLLGGAGDDRIDGGGGNDVLFGEAGADTFVIGANAGIDTIGDFTVGTDKLDLSAYGFADFAALQAAMTDQAGGISNIALGNGDYVILIGVTKAQLGAGDVILRASAAATDKPLVLPGDTKHDVMPELTGKHGAGVAMAGIGDEGALSAFDRHELIPALHFGADGFAVKPDYPFDF